MRVLISVDAEGITGIHKLSQVLPTGKEYGFLRSMMTSDVNAAARGAFDAGASEVFINDCHNTGDNLLISELDPRVKLYSGADKPLIMAEGLDKGFDALMLVGYHSRKGAKGVVSHTFYYSVVTEATVNGIPFGEADFVAHTAGYFGTPIVMLTGDDCVTAYAKQRMPGIYTVAVKEYIGNGSALLYHPVQTAEAIQSTARSAVADRANIKPLSLPGPYTLEITFPNSTQAQLACTVPGFAVSSEKDCSVKYKTDDYFDLYKAFLGAIRNAAAFKEQI